jgi:hypothetical protein
MYWLCFVKIIAGMCSGDMDLSGELSFRLPSEAPDYYVILASHAERALLVYIYIYILIIVMLITITKMHIYLYYDINKKELKRIVTNISLQYGQLEPKFHADFLENLISYS